MQKYRRSLTWNRYARVLGIASVSFLLANCGGGDSGGSPVAPRDPPRATSIAPSASSVSFDALGATTQISATVSDQFGATMTTTVTWATSNQQVATVTDAGLVTAVTNGSATVTATAGAASASAAVTVQQAVASLVIEPESVTLILGETLALVVTIEDGLGNEIEEASVSWSSTDAKVVSVTGDGILLGLAPGVATVTATAQGVSGSATVTVEPDLSDFIKDYIEAIFLGSGPLIPQDNFTACVTNPGRWAAFPRGSTVNVIASNTLDMGSDNVDTKALIQAALATVEEATLGEITTTFATTDHPDPIPTAGQATATDHPDPVSTGCAFDRGCVHIGFSDVNFTVIESSRSVLMEAIQPADAYVHDLIGHGIMGMCHIDQELIGGNNQSLMAGGPGAFTGLIPDQLSPFDILAAQAVYGTDLKPGATQADFLAKGLIRP